jgi:hypothetical protein
VLWLAAALGCAAMPSLGVAAPFLPESDAQVLERLPGTPGDAQAREVRARRAALANDPRNLALALEAARADVTRARAEGDPRFLGYAQAALAPWWDAAEPPSEVLLLRAAIRQGLHDFEGALGDLRAVLDRDPANAQAWLTQALIQQTRGDYAEARRSCTRLLAAARRSTALQLTALTCANSVASFAGEAGRSYGALRAAFAAEGDAAAAERAAAADRVWILGVLADMATRLGDVAAARVHYEDALALAPRDSVLRMAYADLLLDQGEAAAALRLLGDETRNDGFLLRVALAERALGAPTLAAHVADLRARFAAARLRNDQRHLREEARFTLELLHDPGAALALAQRDWAVQREPEDARVLLAAAAAAGDDAAAAPVREWIAAHRVEDVRLGVRDSGRAGGG